MPSICILTTVHDPFDSRVFHKQARSLARAGYAVILIGQGAPDRTIDGVRLQPFPAKPPARQAWRRWLRLPQMWQRARRERADAYLLHDPELTPVGLILKLGGRCVVYDVHEHVPYQILDKAWIPARLRKPVAWLYDYYERAIVGRFDAIVVAFEQIAARFPRAHPVIIRNVPELDRWQRANAGGCSPDGKVIAVYAGAVQPDRCVLELAQAAALLDPALKVEVWVAGRAVSPEYEAQIRAAGGDRVRLLGTLPHEQIPALLAGAHIGLMSLRPQPNSTVNWPIKLFEYMAAGLPMLMTRSAFWADLAGDSAIQVNIEDPRDIARGLEALARDPVLRASLGHQGYERARNCYDWAEQERALVALFTRLIGPPGGQEMP
ncbi:glycosyltransferase [Aggregatilinea lenta]|uniref:glycosyltransferase n=1 Tax=Aggregatilinea lenta TaxID=913108 RepID=UPI000E5BB72A|nr:glycosyltransferase [Aggregatilinea lenta]